MYRDVRSAVDLCHRDGTLKRMVAKDPTRYLSFCFIINFFCYMATLIFILVCVPIVNLASMCSFQFLHC
jgi:hypothetical protein